MRRGWKRLAEPAANAAFDDNERGPDAPGGAHDFGTGPVGRARFHGLSAVVKRHAAC